MKQEEVKATEVVSKINAFGVEIDEPVRKDPSVKGSKMKPPAPTDGRGFGSVLG